MSLHKLSLYLGLPVFALVAVMSFGVQSAAAVPATYYFVGTGDTFSTAGSWHSADKACDDLGDGSVPGVEDTVIFKTCATSVTIPGATALTTLTLDTGYTGTVTAGAALDLSADLNIASGATFDLNGVSMTIGGDFTNAGGTFTHNNGTVTLDGTTQAVAGGTFYNLTKSVSSADTLSFKQGGTNTITNALTLTGASGALLTVNSQVSGTATTLDASSATKTVSFLSVKDVTSSGGTINCTTGCINIGNNAGWIFNASDTGTTGPTSVSTASVSYPGAGAHLMGGSVVTISYSAGAQDLDSILLSISIDGGKSFTVIESGLENTGSYEWTVPNTDALRTIVRVSGIDANGYELISNDSPVFVLEATTAVVEEPVDQPVDETPSSFDGVDMVKTDGQSVRLVAGGLFRGQTLSGVYMVNADGTRSVFPTEKVFASYGYSFDDVVTVNDDQLSALALGARVTMASGELVKIQSDNRVFQVGEGGVLHHVASEAAALSAFGANWASLITDINVVFWGDYTVGSDL
ncbi:hypothetical protein COV06_04095 [Candidatus Uhrbacteria bacterium CG10_big_fil_rev_8_21_14_0_10_50_16]|uniref:Uncharacterized protein n=1 Tax=Candidatus Uhrbacteria bacterium CG10_big_fil_rev_8_21_14_0_10_50_16 TaxID=1975039 RepID=A0A2H0RL65_9BACT|nr:MAG: hypothetical protein COV06_04095 [Candidatus Uhrbacteria bacterium CG10_big_fil_rev_8_21_14_0_10_50_16]